MRNESLMMALAYEKVKQWETLWTNYIHARQMIDTKAIDILDKIFEAWDQRHFGNIKHRIGFSSNAKKLDRLEAQLKEHGYKVIYNDANPSAFSVEKIKKG